MVQNYWYVRTNQKCLLLNLHSIGATLHPSPVYPTAGLEVYQHQVIVRASRHQAVVLIQEGRRHGTGVGQGLALVLYKLWVPYISLPSGVIIDDYLHALLIIIIINIHHGPPGLSQGHADPRDGVVVWTTLQGREHGLVDPSLEVVEHRPARLSTDFWPLR